jgi:hypothetical protein
LAGRAATGVLNTANIPMISNPFHADVVMVVASF